MEETRKPPCAHMEKLILYSFPVHELPKHKASCASSAISDLGLEWVLKLRKIPSLFVICVNLWFQWLCCFRLMVRQKYGGERRREAGRARLCVPLIVIRLWTSARVIHWWTQCLRTTHLSSPPAGSLWGPQQSPKVFYSLSQCAVCLACIFCSSMIKWVNISLLQNSISDEGSMLRPFPLREM